MSQARRRLASWRRLLLGAAVVLGPLSALPVSAGSEVPSRDWRASDVARLRRDMRAATRRFAEAAARERRDWARAHREERRYNAQEFGRSMRALASARREQMRQMRIEMQNALRELRLELKQSLGARGWRGQGWR